MTTTHRVPVPGASIHYEVRGSGPVLVTTYDTEAGIRSLSENHS